MNRMKVISHAETIHASGEQIFSQLTDFNRFGKMLPEQVKNWESNEDYCKFVIHDFITITLRITEKINFSKIVYQMENDRQIPASITLLLNEKENHQELFIELEMDIPVLFAGMVKKPLQDFVNMLALKIKQEAEKQ
jgi:hypothetical protein